MSFILKGRSSRQCHTVDSGCTQPTVFLAHILYIPIGVSHREPPRLSPSDHQTVLNAVADHLSDIEGHELGDDGEGGV